MVEDQECTKLCEGNIPGVDASFINTLISQSYGLDWQVDGLPVKHKGEDTEKGLHSVGFHLGEDRNSFFLFNNHYDIDIEYHKKNDLYRVVGAIVTPSR